VGIAAVSVPSNFARLLVEKYELELPIDIETLLKEYADLVFADIPFKGADGISLNLKVIGKTTRVIVNKNMPAIRQRFTMAHELGHVIIPWHVGTIIDHVDPTKADKTSRYWEVEEEANTFAAELLMPYSFIERLTNEEKDLSKINRIISRQCEVSPIASSIRLLGFVPTSVVYAYERYGIVEYSGRSSGTLASKLDWESDFPNNPYDYAAQHFQAALNGGTIHWWELPEEIHFDVDDESPWRDILNKIVKDIGVPQTEAKKFKSSVNGVVAYANGSCKKGGRYTVDSVVSAGIQRFKDRGGFEDFVSHQDFNSFLVKKAQELVKGNR
jgi:Zn-dependent peptidase ImmA (M78 family)